MTQVIMTPQDIIDATETFGRYGVPKDRIFKEVMRARYLDYVLFQNPSNQEFGVSIEDLYESMKKTADELGMYEGDADTYARVYTLALRVDPMVFAGNVPKTPGHLKEILQEAVQKAKQAGKTVLFTGADRYLNELALIFGELGGKRIAAALEDASRKPDVQRLFPRGRIMPESELTGDAERYDYIFNLEEESPVHAEKLSHLLAEKGTMDIVMPYSFLKDSTAESAAARQTLAKSGRLAQYYDAEIDGEEYAFLRFEKEEMQEILFGEADFSEGCFKGYPQMIMSTADFLRADDWNYDIYLYNSIPAVQAILCGNILDMDFSLGCVCEAVQEEELPAGIRSFLPAEAVQESGLRKDLLISRRPEKGEKGICTCKGDLAIAASRGKVMISVITEDEPIRAGKGIFLFRPKEQYTAEYLKLFLDGPVGHLFLDAMKSGDTYHFTHSRILRIPVPKAERETIEKATAVCREVTEQLAAAEANWRQAKKESVALMMGH